MKSEYLPKQITENREVARLLTKSMTGTHFSLESPGCKDTMKSSTKLDYVKHQYNVYFINEVVPTRYPKKPGTENQYPLLQFEEQQKETKKKIFIPKRRLDERKNVDSSAKSLTSVSLGNDQNDWASVSKVSLVSHPNQPRPAQSDYEALEKSRSTVLDNPDLVLDPMQSVQQSGNSVSLEFRLSQNLDRSNLIYDNTASKKALKGTHFSLGNESSMQSRSEYLTSFIQVSQPRRENVGIKTSDRNCIIAEDFEDRRTGETSQKLDYRQIAHQKLSVNQYDIKVYYLNLENKR